MKWAQQAIVILPWKPLKLKPTKFKLAFIEEEVELQCNDKNLPAWLM